jgi:hypothetical protein
MRFLLIIILLTASVIMELNTFNFNFVYSQQLKQQSSSGNDLNASKTLNTTNSDNNSSSNIKANDDLANYLGYQYEYNFY